MSESEITKAIYIAINMFLLAMILTMFSTGLQLRNDYAKVKNEQLRTELHMQDYREFNKYDMNDCTGDGEVDKHIYGNEVVELIRNYYNSPKITIWLDMTSNSSNSKRGVYLFGNMAKHYYDSGNSPSASSFRNCDSSFKELQNLISPKDEFHTYLVYNSNNPDYIDERVVGGDNSEVTAVKIILTKEN